MTENERSQQDFYDAFVANDPARLETSLRAGADPNRKDAQRGLTFALIVAVVHAQRDMLRVLLKYGADPNIADDLGDTPLLVAARIAEPDIAEALLDAGARMDVVDRDGLNPEGIARNNRNRPLERLLQKAAAQRKEDALNAQILPMTAGSACPIPIRRPLRLKLRV